MKRRRFAPLEFHFYKMGTEYDWWYILPSVEVKRKYWYLWEILFSWGKWAVMLEISRKDWKDYDN